MLRCNLHQDLANAAIRPMSHANADQFFDTVLPVPSMLSDVEPEESQESTFVDDALTQRWPPCYCCLSPCVLYLSDLMPSMLGPNVANLQLSLRPGFLLLPLLIRSFPPISSVVKILRVLSPLRFHQRVPPFVSHF